MNSASTESLATVHERVKTAIVVGASARACAQSLLRAGITPITIDLFADRDLKKIARTHLCPMEGYPEAIPGIIKNQLSDVDHRAPVIITGAMENHVDVMLEIEKSRLLFSGSARAVEKARSPQLLKEACDAVGGACLEMLPRLPSDTPPERLFAISPDWVMKPFKSSAGHGIVFFDAQSGIPTPRPGQQAYFQPWIGSTGNVDAVWDVSAAFTSQKGKVTFIGVSLQIIGGGGFGARHQTQYVGNICAGGPQSVLTANQIDAVTRLGQEVATRSGIQGPFGIDMIGKWPFFWETRVDRLHVLEVNPRYTGGMEVIEKATGQSVFGGSARQAATGVCGKAIVYAREDCTVWDLWRDLSQEDVADVPNPGEQVPGGRPICTVMAQGRDVAQCRSNLASLADRVYTLCQP